MRKLFLTFSLSLLVLSCFSQTDPFPDDAPCGPPFGDPCPIPIDGGVGFLIAAGLVYGGKKANDLKKKD